MPSKMSAPEEAVVIRVEDTETASGLHYAAFFLGCYSVAGYTDEGTPLLEPQPSMSRGGTYYCFIERGAGFECVSIGYVDDDLTFPSLVEATSWALNETRLERETA